MVDAKQSGQLQNLANSSSLPIPLPPGVAAHNKPNIMIASPNLQQSRPLVPPPPPSVQAPAGYHHGYHDVGPFSPSTSHYPNLQLTPQQSQSLIYQTGAPPLMHPHQAQSLIYPHTAHSLSRSSLPRASLDHNQLAAPMQSTSASNSLPAGSSIISHNHASAAATTNNYHHPQHLHSNSVAGATNLEDFKKAFDELRNNTWTHLSKSIIEHAQHFDIPSLIGTLSIIREANEKLVNKIRDLTVRRDQLLIMSARLDMPAPLLTQHLNNTSPSFSSLVAGLTSSPKSMAHSPNLIHSPNMAHSPSVAHTSNLAHNANMQVTGIVQPPPPPHSLISVNTGLSIETQPSPSRVGPPQQQVAPQLVEAPVPAPKKRAPRRKKPAENPPPPKAPRSAIDPAEKKTKKRVRKPAATKAPPSSSNSAPISLEPPTTQPKASESGSTSNTGDHPVATKFETPQGTATTITTAAVTTTASILTAPPTTTTTTTTTSTIAPAAVTTATTSTTSASPTDK